jgi:hypothetical protein
MSANQCALNEMMVRGIRWTEQGSGNPMTCYQVIEWILKPFSCTLKQENGYYLISNKHELNSPAYTFAWGSGTPGLTFLPDKIVPLAGYQYERAVISKIEPKKEMEITWQNYDGGLDDTGIDLTDWSGNYVHTFISMEEGPFDLIGNAGYTAAGEVRLYSNTGFSTDYIELANNFAVTRNTDDEYLRITFAIRTYRANPSTWNDPFVQISIYNSVRGTWAAYYEFIPITYVSRVYETPLGYAFRVSDTANYNVRITFFARNSNSYDGYFFLKDLTINKVQGATSLDSNDAESIVLDAWYLQDSQQNAGIIEDKTLIGDGVGTSSVGSIIYDDSGTDQFTLAWSNSYAGASGLKLLDIWARNELNDRAAYKDFLRFTVHDLDHSIFLDSILSINGRYYTIISYSKDMKYCLTTCDVEELLTTSQSYNEIQYAYLNTVDGTSIADSPNNTNENSIAHNFTLGLQGGAEGELFHFTYAQYTEITAWIATVILSSNGGVDLTGTGVLQVDDITESTTDHGIDAEGVHLQDGGITLATGPAVNYIETVLTDSDTRLPTSGAVMDAISTITYLGSSLNVVTSDGYTGDIDSLDAQGDADILQVEEATGNPGFDIRVTFSSVDAFNNILINCYYHAGANHEIDVDVYNPTTTNWETVYQFTDQSQFEWISIPIYNGNSYISGTDTVIVRIYHNGNGNASHYIEVDYWAINDQPIIGAGGGVTAHNNLTGLSSDDHSQQ